MPVTAATTNDFLSFEELADLSDPNSYSNNSNSNLYSPSFPLESLTLPPTSAPNPTPTAPPPLSFSFSFSFSPLVSPNLLSPIPTSVSSFSFFPIPPSSIPQKDTQNDDGRVKKLKPLESVSPASFDASPSPSSSLSPLPSPLSHPPSPHFSHDHLSEDLQLSPASPPYSTHQIPVPSSPEPFDPEGFLCLETLHTSTEPTPVPQDPSPRSQKRTLSAAFSKEETLEEDFELKEEEAEFEDGQEEDLDDDHEAEDYDEWVEPRRPRPGLSLTLEEVEMVLNCFDYFSKTQKNKKICCSDVGTALKVGTRKVYEIVQEREKLILRGAPPGSIPLARGTKKRGKPRERALGPEHFEALRSQALRGDQQPGEFLTPKCALAFLQSLPDKGQRLPVLGIDSPGPTTCNPKTLKGYLTSLRREILPSRPPAKKRK